MVVRNSAVQKLEFAQAGSHSSEARHRSVKPPNLQRSKVLPNNDIDARPGVLYRDHESSIAGARSDGSSVRGG